MPDNFEVSFNSPQCGWMSIGFSDGEREFHTTTAHAPHGEALPQLLQTLASLLNEDSSENEFLLPWNRDPEEFDFRFIRTGNDLTLEIYQYPTEEREVSEREMVFSHTGPIDEICRAFDATFDQLYADRDTDEFEFNWRQPFPLSEYTEFKEKLRRR
jgi:hypothetical protein